MPNVTPPFTTTCAGWDNDSWSYLTRIVVQARFKSWRSTTTVAATPPSEWQRYEIGASSDASLRGSWANCESLYTSANDYAYSLDENAEISLRFEGEKLRLHYLYFWNFGIFEVYIDDELVATIDGYNPQSLVAAARYSSLNRANTRCESSTPGSATRTQAGILSALMRLTSTPAAKRFTD